MQRDHYLPLKVIREHLDALERGERRPLPAPGGPREAAEARCGEPRRRAARGGPDRPRRAAGRRRGRARRSWPSGSRTACVTPVAEGGYDVEAVTVARLVVELGRFGLEPRHLRAMKAAAEREAGLVEQVVAPAAAAPQSADQGACGGHRRRSWPRSPCGCTRHSCGPPWGRSRASRRIVRVPDYPNLPGTS